jgi:hypothetical protein
MRNTETNPYPMNKSLDIRNNPNEIYENDFAVINLNSEEITWKSGMFNPKLRKDILFHLKNRNK